MNIKLKTISAVSFVTTSKTLKDQREMVCAASLSKLKTTATDRKFHQLIKQSLMGLPIDKLLKTEPQYQFWFEQVQKKAPYFWTLPENQKAVDYTINYCYKEYRFCTTYDLLLAEIDKAEIIHFRTDSEISFDDLSKHPCAQLDLFLLVQNLGYLPEQVSLTYWFLSETQAFKLSIPYHSKLHKDLAEQMYQGNSHCLTTPMSVAQFDESSRNSPPTAFAQENSLTERFLKGEMTAIQYLDEIPEVEL